MRKASGQSRRSPLRQAPVTSASLLKGVTGLFSHPNDTPDEKEIAKQGGIKTIAHNGVTWIDVENPSKRNLTELAEQYSLHPLHIEESLSTQQLPQLEKESNYLFLTLYLPSYSADGKKIINGHVRVFLGKNYVLTIHNDIAHELREWMNVCEEDAAQRKVFIGKSSGVLLYHLVASILTRVGTLTQNVLQGLDDIEDSVFDDNISDVYRIGQMRQQIIKLKQVAKSSRLVLRDITTNAPDLIDEHLSRYYKKNENLNEELAEAIDEAQEIIEIYKDADFTTSTEKTNKILAILTIIFTYGIPATVLGTFYGMNVNLPGGIEAGPWNFLGTYTTLILAVTTSIVLALAMFWYFRKKKWF